MQIAANAVGTIPASPEKETTEQVSKSQTTLFSDVQSQSAIDSLGSLSDISLDPSMEFDSTLITMDKTGLPVSNGKKSIALWSSWKIFSHFTLNFRFSSVSGNPECFTI